MNIRDLNCAERREGWDYGWDARFDMIVLAVWETWTRNGARLDAEDREEALKAVRDAATNSYVDRMDDGEWQAATLALLTGR